MVVKHLSDRQAKELLNKIHDPTDMEAIIAQLKQEPDNVELAKQLESQAYGARLQRMANLQAQMDSIILSIFAEERRKSRQLYTQLAEEAYYKAIFDLQQYTGYGFAFKTLSRKNIERILNTNWHGGNFSEHIWDNTEQLAERIKQELVLNILTGRPLRRANLAIEQRFQTGYYNAKRLVRTESTYITNQLHKEAYEACGVQKYIYVAILDLRTSEICKSLDKQSFLLSKAIAGINFPPMHPFCRSTIIAWVPQSLLAKMKQSAIDPATGKRITLPGDMAYQQWYEKYVKGKAVDPKIKKQRSANAANAITGRVVPVNEDATFKVDIPGYSKEINNVISESCRKVVYDGEKTGNEVLHLIDLDTGKIAFKETGGAGFVGGKDYHEFTESHKGRYAFVHNHPDGDGLSEQDVASLLTNKNIEVMIGSGNNGKVYIGISKEENNLNFYKEYSIMKKQAREEQKWATDLYKNGDMIYPEYSRIIEREAGKKLIQKYGDLYEMET